MAFPQEYRNNRQYEPTEWIDRVEASNGDVLVEGTPMDEIHLGNLETGVLLSHLDIGLLTLFNNQQLIQVEKEIEKFKNQRILQGQATIKNTNGSNGYFRSSHPFVQVALNGFAQLNAPNYAVLLEPLTGDMGMVGNLEVYDKAQNGFKVRMTGTASSVSFQWTLVNMAVK